VEDLLFLVSVTPLADRVPVLKYQVPRTSLYSLPLVDYKSLSRDHDADMSVENAGGADRIAS